MDIVEALTLALIQGLTEFLPISSSGHLILTPAFFGWTDQGLSFDIAVHLGTLCAVIVYFRRDLLAMTRDLFVADSADGRLARQLLLASVPLGLAGVLTSDLVETALREPFVIAAASAGFGVLLWAADRWRRGDLSERDLGLGQVMLIGLGQVLALIPGTSRSGITMTVALALGLSREAAARFSFLLAIPAIGMAAAWQAFQFARAPETLDWRALVPATIVAAAMAFIAIALFLRLIGRLGMGVFAAYRILLAVVIVYVLV
ncbi:MAG TPA: undecaprenyl-diphosphate phosphatase [Gammaproteobacteria bacterium]|nr:undecaprenyl-diphosphate phosphatase [Gammaproteobacteria bacterium]